MIKSFADKDTERFFNRQRVRQFQPIEKPGLRKLAVLNEATGLTDLRSPGNNLESLKHTHPGFYSVRVNDRFRLIFRWSDGDAYDVAITDYH